MLKYNIKGVLENACQIYTLFMLLSSGQGIHSVASTPYEALRLNEWGLDPYTITFQCNKLALVINLPLATKTRQDSPPNIPNQK